MIAWAFVIFGFVFMASLVGAMVYECWREYHD